LPVINSRAVQFQLGIAACVLSIFLIFIGIPNGVSSPSNVNNIVLSPAFWPYVLSAITGLIGLGLLFGARRTGSIGQANPGEQADTRDAPGMTGWLRLLALAAIMIITMFLLPRLGMVWTTMLLFLFTTFLFRTRHPRTAVVCAILIPLGLYLFFAHVAGVGIPQGNYIRLP